MIASVTPSTTSETIIKIGLNLSKLVETCPNWFKLFLSNFRDEDEEDDDDSSVGGLNRQIRKLSSRTLEFCDSIDELSTVNKKESDSSLHSGLV